MDNREFIKILNDYYKNEKMQIIPAFSFKKAPKNPYATFQTRDIETNDYLLDKRKVVNNKIMEYMNVYSKEKLLFKVYNSTEIDTFNQCVELLDVIRFKTSENARYKGYGLLNVGDIRQFNEVEDGGYIYCYGFEVEIDYNTMITREIDILTEIEITGDITLNFKEG